MGYVAIKLKKFFFFNQNWLEARIGLQAIPSLPTLGLDDLQDNSFKSQNQVGKDVPILSMTG